MKIVIATKNEGKVKEFQSMFADMEVMSLLDIDDAPDIEETGSTFAENAAIKAEGISSIYNIPVIADDSGLVIDALNGRPGVFSARYAGMEKDDDLNMEKVLSEMSDVPDPDRSARFVCALAIAVPGKKTIIVEGYCEGSIARSKAGSNGFGYDPIFYVKSKEKTMAQLSQAEKNKISHRANALEKLAGHIHLLF